MQQGVILKLHKNKPGIAVRCRVTGGAYAVTVMLWPSKFTVWPATILQRLRVSTTPSTLTRPSAMASFACAPLSLQPSSFSKSQSYTCGCLPKENVAILCLLHVVILFTRL